MNRIKNAGKISGIEAQLCVYLAKDKNCSPIEAFRIFSSSKLHEMLVDADDKMYFFSAEALYDIYKVEEETGEPRNSTYLSGDSL